MQKLLLGLFTGIILAIITLVALFLVLRSSKEGLPVTNFRPTTTPTGAAGTERNFAAALPEASRLRLTTALADSRREATTVNPTDLTSVEITVGRAEAILTQPLPQGATSSTTPDSFPRTEILDITQPVIELFSLRGSGSLAEVGTTELAPGNYQRVRLVITSAKGRQPNGRVVDITLPGETVIIETTQPRTWAGSPKELQLVFDLDTFASLEQRGGEYIFAPVVQQILENDQLVETSESR